MKIFRINKEFGRTSSILIPFLLFAVFIGVYVLLAHIRHQENPDDKLVPTLPQIANGFLRTAYDKNVDLSELESRLKSLDSSKFVFDSTWKDQKMNFLVFKIKTIASLHYGFEISKTKIQIKLEPITKSRLLNDTLVSGRRFLIGVLILFLSVFIGLNMGMFALFEKLLLRFALFFEKVPPLALLAILFVIFGLGETAKIVLIALGAGPTVVLDTYLNAKNTPKEQIVKGFSLGATDWEIAYRIVLPQIFPRVLDTIRLSLRAVIGFLIVAEALASTEGLGYRIFVVRRYMAMDIIIPYVLWLSLLAFLIDFGMRLWITKKYKWYKAK